MTPPPFGTFPKIHLILLTWPVPKFADKKFKYRFFSFFISTDGEPWDGPWHAWLSCCLIRNDGEPTFSTDGDLLSPLPLIYQLVKVFFRCRCFPPRWRTVCPPHTTSIPPCQCTTPTGAWWAPTPPSHTTPTTPTTPTGPPWRCRTPTRTPASWRPSQRDSSRGGSSWAWPSAMWGRLLPTSNCPVWAHSHNPPSAGLFSQHLWPIKPL